MGEPSIISTVVTHKPLRWFATGIACVGALTFVACGGGESKPLPFQTVTTSAQEPTATEAAAASATPEATVSLATLHDAREALRAGDYVQAAAAFGSIAGTATEPQLQAEARMGAAVALYQSGDLQGSIDNLEEAFTASVGTPSERRVGYLYGLRLVEAGDSALATGVLGSLALRDDDVLSPYIAAALASARVLEGDIEGANEAWDAALAHPLVNDTVRLGIYRERADLALEEGASAVAADWLRLSTDLRATPDDRYELATLASSIGDWDTFAVQLRTIMVEAPGSRFAEMAIDDLTAQGYSVDQGQAGFVHYRRRNYETARSWLSNAANEAGITAADKAFRTYYLAASYDDAGLYEEAVPLYDSVATIDPTSPYVHRAYYWSARALENLERATEASERYVAIAQGPDGEFSDEARFRAGFVLFEAGDPQGAIAYWEYAGAREDGRLLYWQGRAYEELGSEYAHQLFLNSAERDPVSFYGQAAAIRLGVGEAPGAGYEDVETPNAIDWNAIASWLQSGATAPDAVESAAIDLADMGLVSVAGQLLAQELESQNRSSLERLAYLRAAHEAGLTDLAARWAFQIAGNRENPPEDLARLVYPLDYVELLREAGEEHGVDPLFLAALIRQESAWDPTALSIANAHGLTQVIPSTGEAIASALGYNNWRVTDLWRPAISIEFGAYYIGAQLRTFGDPHVALSAYNGGPGHAGTWQANSDSPDPADFVEAVTFTETKGYVVRVMENYARYKDLYR